MIIPTVGRIVHYYPERDARISHDPGKPLAAMVCAVHGPELVNLSVCDAAGAWYPRTSVRLYQGEGPRPDYAFAEWMPYQVQQAAKREAAPAGTLGDLGRGAQLAEAEPNVAGPAHGSTGGTTVAPDVT